MLEKLDEIRENLFHYVEARIELFTLETRSKVEKGVVMGIHGLVLGILALMTVIFLFALLAAYLNQVLESHYLGFVIVSGFFLLLTLIWVAARQTIQTKITLLAYKAMKKNQEKKAEEKRAEAMLLAEKTKTIRPTDP